MARRNKKGWLGDFSKGSPNYPDKMLAQYLGWERGTAPASKQRATCKYPEPINITCASAWLTPPDISDCKYALVYRDPASKLWIKVQAILEVPLSQIEPWRMREIKQGALLTWTNKSAKPVRPQPTLNEQDNEPGTNNHALDPVTLTVRLQQMDKYKIGDYDVVAHSPEMFRFKDVANIAKARRPIKRRGVTEGPGSGNTKCLSTPDGVFTSATLASMHYNKSLTWVTLRASKNKHGFKYITQEEYELIKQNPNINTVTEADS